ncbi:AP-5 complex subunit sigma-1-like [Mytilus galloprovincialis]|uniref:AP-5 complex subunit sigma-1-like n=1 Tax=Mytilus galloprovincialis TaxID=29158 RepID=UPI003F7C0A64
MVHAFLIHTLIPGSTKLLYHQIYAQDSQLRHVSDNGVIGERKRCLVECAAQVHSEYQFRRAILGRSVEDDVQRIHSEDTLPEFELGYTRLEKDSPFNTEKIAVWLGAGYTCFTLICEKTENRMLAETVLKTLIRFLQQHVGLLTSPTEACTKPERISVILDKFLPQGNLLFMNHRVIRQLEKETESIIKQ